MDPALPLLLSAPLCSVPALPLLCLDLALPLFCLDLTLSLPLLLLSGVCPLDLLVCPVDLSELRDDLSVISDDGLLLACADLLYSWSVDPLLSLGLAPVDDPVEACSDASEDVLLNAVFLLDDSALVLEVSTEALRAVNSLLVRSDDSLCEFELLPDSLLEL